MYNFGNDNESNGAGGFAGLRSFQSAIVCIAFKIQSAQCDHLTKIFFHIFYMIQVAAKKKVILRMLFQGWMETKRRIHQNIDNNCLVKIPDINKYIFTGSQAVKTYCCVHLFCDKCRKFRKRM